jgi:uncharacterized protein YqhQ
VAADGPKWVGGQAVLEGVMMRGARSWAVAVRRPDGSIDLTVEDAPAWGQRWSSVPLVRGVVALAESMSLGVRALAWSGRPEDDDTPLTPVELAGTLAVGLVGFAALFLVVPAVVTKLAQHRLAGRLGFNLFEGGLRLALFLGYLVAIGRLAGVRRVFEYHGAEHKAIAAWERGVPVTPESAQTFTTEHVRCGTNFLLLVMVLTIAGHTLVGRPGWAGLLLSRVLLLPLVAAVAYELVRAAADRLDRGWVRAVMAPGLALQRLTTREPGLDQLEVAIAALLAVLTAEQRADVDLRAAA